MAKQKKTSVPDRSGDTRERLLRAALEEFGTHGYEGVSTRQLANHAGVNLAAIPYHFGGKEGIYLAVAEQIVASVGGAMRSRTGAIQDELRDGRPLSQKRLLEHLHSLLGGLARVLLGSPDAHLWAGIILREQMRPTRAFDILYSNVMEQIHRTLTRIIARLLDKPDDDPDCILRAHTVIGEVVMFRAAREAIMRRMDWDGYTPERVEHITQLVIAQTSDMLLAQRRRERTAK
jgi:AcrR family transcriptional regulator